MAFFQHAYGPVPPSSESEENIIQRVRSGDQTALEEIFRTHYDGLCRFTAHLINSSDDVEDLVQDIFVRIWLKRENWHPKGSIRAYLFKAAHNQALNFLKSRQVRDVANVQIDDLFPSDSSTDPVEEMINRDVKASISKAIETLPKKCRLVFTLNRQDGLSYSEIADVLNISVRTVENQIARALKALRKELADIAG